MSRKIVQLFKYHKSCSILFLMFSGFGVAPLNPFTCAQPVKPGLHLCLFKKLLNNPEIDPLDDNINLSVYKHDFKSTKVIKDKVRKISKIIKELKGFK